MIDGDTAVPCIAYCASAASESPLLLQRGASEVFCGQPGCGPRLLPAHGPGPHQPHPPEVRQAAAAGAREGHLLSTSVSAQRAQRAQTERLRQRHQELLLLCRGEQVASSGSAVSVHVVHRGCKQRKRRPLQVSPRLSDHTAPCRMLCAVLHVEPSDDGGCSGQMRYGDWVCRKTAPWTASLTIPGLWI